MPSACGPEPEKGIALNVRRLSSIKTNGRHVFPAGGRAERQRQVDDELAGERLYQEEGPGGSRRPAERRRQKKTLAACRRDSSDGCRGPIKKQKPSKVNAVTSSSSSHASICAALVVSRFKWNFINKRFAELEVFIRLIP